MNTNRLISRNAMVVMAVMIFTCMWIPIGKAAVTGERILPRPYYLQGQQNLMVKIQITGEEDSVIIHETIPLGWTVYRTLNNGIVNDRTISWELTSVSGSTKVTYYVNTPDIVGNDAQFSGVINGDPIGGDHVMAPRQPIPTPGKQVPMYDPLYNYWLYLPSDYSEQEGQWPILLFLHGGCLTGTDLDLVLTHYTVSVLTILENPDDAQKVPELFQSIVVSPQSTTLVWDINRLKDFCAELLSTYSIDPNRLYLMTHASGADAGWALANEFPDLLAAFYSGGMLATAPSVSANMAGLPVWVFETELFKTISLSIIESCINEIRTLGGECVYTYIPATTTFSLTDVYYNPEIYRWFLRQNKQSRFSGIAHWEMY
ncbi:MAG: hypothetical protein C4527_19925 [Candidatus Omnitrophota bacterium]|jgi:predicted esterase|nr:MAG: hypothetical protein C4527_19925 [Candidatus Omnitrophota bacterium]